MSLSETLQHYNALGRTVCCATASFILIAVTPSEAQFNNQVSLSSGSFGYVIIEDDTGTPGLVCDDEFADSNAGCEVVCRQLGLQ